MRRRVISPSYTQRKKNNEKRNNKKNPSDEKKSNRSKQQVQTDHKQLKTTKNSQKEKPLPSAVIARVPPDREEHLIAPGKLNGR